MVLNACDDWSIQSVESCPCDTIANPCPPGIPRLPVGKVRRDGRVRVQEKRVTGGCEREPELVGDSPTGKRSLINRQGGHTGGGGKANDPEFK